MRRVVITGAFSYTGAATARELERRGYHVHTLTNRRPPAASAITCAPLLFEPQHLDRQLEGASALVNTFWVRLPYGGQSFDTAVEQSRILVEAARRAGVRLVHVSVSNAERGKNLGYYRGKAEVEEAVRAAGVPYGIVRPTLVVGPADVLSNNIAWFLRRFPLFPLPDGGDYPLQPVTLRDTARIIADALEATANVELDAAGPETLSFADYVRLLGRACGVSRWLPSVPGGLALFCLRLLQPFLRDIVLTREELLGLQQGLLTSDAKPLGTESVTAWLMTQRESLGRAYVNDLGRHFKDGKSEPVLDPQRLDA